MRKLIYSMTVSLDGFIAAPGGNIDWTAPDEELHQFHNDEVRELGAHLLGRRLYETMVFWETADQDPALPAVMLEFARIWKPLPKIVFSSTLERVEGNARLASGDVADEVARLKEEPNLIDDYRLFVSPVVLGAGTPYFPAREQRIGLELLETRTFGGGVVYLRYARV